MWGTLVKSNELAELKNNSISEKESFRLIREIGLFPAVMLVVGNTIGTGIFTTSGFVIKELKDPGALLLVWILGGLIALFGAISYAELGKMFPRAGGEYTFLRESFGEVFGFLAGWISLIVGFSAPIAATAIAFSKYFLELFHLQTFEVTSKLLAILVILFLSFVHTQKIKIGANFQAGITLFKIFFLFAFIFLGFLCIKENLNTLGMKSLIPKKETILSLNFPVSLIYVMYAYSGWNAATYVGEEIKNPQRNIPLALLLGVLLVVVLYVGINILYVRALSVEEMSGVVEIGAKTAEKIFGGKLSFLFTAGITLGLLSVLSAMIIAGPRVYYAMARDGVFFKVFSRVHPEKKTPIFSILLQAMIAIFMVLTSTFEALLLYIGFTLSLCASLTVLGFMKLKKKFIFPAFAFILANLWMMIFAILTKPLTLLAGFLTILAGFVLYQFKFNQKLKI
ncbi:amino acid permease-associated region [Thermodesulfobacterium geofontis OPF15]|jgi:APA family basic amino acid/polyamine antiporter|uniref:Amino acid permease-associated region n=1 Tax=Thermodesulfobacterium geofontis (strain OPF15) TaxID=795359 RepID=F8C564_THEGP|nr:amino acid permease-associated region [Thermodesulfobacterium geofontis OPF15]